MFAPVEQIPLASEDELPFVVHDSSDPRPYLGVEGLRLRRSSDRILVEMQADDVWVNMILLDTEAGTFFTASLGPMLNAFWEAYARQGTTMFTASEMARCPLLITALMHHTVPMLFNDETVNIAVVPPAGDVVDTIAVVGVEVHATQELTEEMIVLAMAPAKLAMGVLGELAALSRTSPAAPRPSVSVSEWMDVIGKGADTAGKVLRVLNTAANMMGP